MLIKIFYHYNGDDFDIVVHSVESIRLTGQREITTNTFGNAPVVHRHVVSFQVLDCGIG